MKQAADRVMPVTRWLSIIFVPFLLAGFIILFLFSDYTTELFAWTIKPRLTALVMGAGYLAGAYFFARAIWAKRWHQVGVNLLTVTAFVWPIGLATLIHWDRFNHSHIAFWIWAAIYLLTPLFVPAVYWLNRQEDPGTAEANEVLVPQVVRWLLAIAGIFELLIGLVMFIAPDWVMTFWPWQLTPLTARVLGGWFALPGAGGLLAALDARWSASRIGIEGGVLWALLILVGLVRAWSDLDTTNPLAWVYAGSIVLSVAALGGLWLAMESKGKQAALPRPETTAV